MRRLFSWLLAACGVFLLWKGGSTVYSWVSAPITADPLIEHVASPSEGALLGYLSIPRLNSKTALVEGITESSLRLGPGHLQGTPLPGEAGNSVVAAHRDTHFRILKDVEVGDKLVIERRSNKTFYAVTSVRVVDPTDVSVLKNTGGSMMTLITCYPFHFIGPAPKRLVVQAIRSEAENS